MRATVTATLLDGSSQTHSGELAPLADRIAFERRYGVNAAVLGRLSQAFNDDGTLRADADATAIREEWVAFLCWRLLIRGPARGVDFEAWLEGMDSLDLNLEDQDETGSEVDPTATVRALPSS